MLRKSRVDIPFTSYELCLRATCYSKLYHVPAHSFKDAVATAENAVIFDGSKTSSGSLVRPFQAVGLKVTDLSKESKQWVVCFK